jgi:hypothetical protein
LQSWVRPWLDLKGDMGAGPAYSKACQDCQAVRNVFMAFRQAVLLCLVW